MRRRPLLLPDPRVAPAPQQDVLRGRTNMIDTGRRLLLGRVLGAFGVRGEIKLESWTEPRSAIFRYQPWILRSPNGQESTLEGARGRDTGKHLVARFPGIEDRDTVEAMHGTEVFVARSALPPPNADEYYWVDLE